MSRSTTPNLTVVCPQDGKILEQCAGEYDAVYVALSPFIRPVSISPDLFCPETYPDHQTIVAACAPVTWAEVQKLGGFALIEEVDIALRTSIHGLRDHLARKDLAERLASCTEGAGLISPAEGDHPELMFAAVMRMFEEKSRSPLVVVSDEFGEASTTYPIGDLLVGKVRLPSHCNIHTPDRSLLWTVHWDSHCTFLCSSMETLQDLKVHEVLEGFYCSQETEVYWSLYPR
jgi:hypothetical protein